jgi:glucokinase
MSSQNPRNLRLGIDLGGTHLRAALVDTNSGALLAVRRVATESQSGEAALLARMAALADDVIAASGIARTDIGGVGVGVPGLIDLERGVVLLLPNVPGDWPRIPFRDTLAGALGLPVHLLNDVRSITLGEWACGAGRGVETMACYAIGTGIGGGVVIGGKLHLGMSGSAGELGHQIVEPDGVPCKCGGRGCLEMYAAGPAIRAQGLEAVAHGWPTRIAELAGGDLNQVTVERMVQAAREGDAIARGIFERAGVYMGLAIANTLLTLSPQKVVLGGGVAEAGDLLLDPIRRTVRERVFLMPADQVEIVKAQLGGDAGLIGAALWSRMCDDAPDYRNTMPGRP